ncbi:MAG TPA: hypothetical protein VMS73_00995 [Anaerolineaceae bacterium]|nr:hypothetical protein [Anaerolineaceae bacterium]
MKTIPLSFFMVPAGFLAAGIVLAWRARRKNTRLERIAYATIFAMVGYLLIEGLDNLYWWEVSSGRGPYLLGIAILVLPLLIAGMAYLFYFRLASVTEVYLEAGLIGLYLAAWFVVFTLILIIFWHWHYSPEGSDPVQFLLVTIALSPFLAAYVHKRAQRQESPGSTPSPFFRRILAGRLGWAATLLGAFIVGFISGIPAMLFIPMGVIFLPLLVLILGSQSRSGFILCLSGIIVYLGHVFALAVAYAVSSNAYDWANLFYRAFGIDLFISAWWFAMIPVSGLALLGQLVQRNGKPSLALVAFLIAALYGYSLFSVERPNVTAEYRILGQVETASTEPLVLTLPLPLNGPGALAQTPTPTARPFASSTPISQSIGGAWTATPTVSDAPLRLTLPLPHSDNGPLTVKPCADWNYPVIKAEKNVPSQWGPAWEVTLTAGEFYRCLEPAPRYSDRVPLLWMRSDSNPAEKMKSPFKITADNEAIQVHLKLTLSTYMRKAQALSPFVGMQILWSEYNYGETMEITTRPGAVWQAAPVVPGQSNQFTGPSIYILPFG